MTPAGDDVAARLQIEVEALFERAPCGYLATLLDGTIVRVNGTFLQWTGFARDELVGRRRFAELLTGGGRIYHETHYAPLLAMQGAVREIALEIVRADGTRLPVLINAAVEDDGGGEPPVVRVTVFDATHRREYERELLRTRDEERAAREQIERLQRVSSALVATDDAGGIGEAVLEAIVEGSPGMQAALVVIDPIVRVLEVAAWRGDRPPHERLPPDHADVALVRRAMERGERLVERDLPATATPLGLPAAAWAGGVTVLPLAVGGHAVGALCLGLVPPADEADVSPFVVAVAEQCALALERARLHRETAVEARRAQLLAAAGRALDEVPDVQGRLARLLALLVPDVADAAWFEPLEGDPPAGVAAPPAALRGLARRALTERRPQTADVGERSCLAVPLVVRDRTVGALVLARGPGRDAFGDAARAFLVELAGRAALALENARLYEREHDIALTLQRGLLAGAPPRDPRLEIAAFYRPAVDGLHVGGDWHDAFVLEPGVIGLVVGDVVGRGLAAATATGALRSAVRALAAARFPPGVLLEHLDGFVESDEAMRMATLMYVELDLGTHRARLASAGHPPVLLMSPGAEPRLVWEGRSPPLGVFDVRTARTQAELALEPGARLLLYTDGLVERRTEALDAGLERLVQHATRHAGEPLPVLVERLAASMLAGAGSVDDVCALGVRVA